MIYQNSQRLLVPPEQISIRKDIARYLSVNLPAEMHLITVSNLSIYRNPDHRFSVLESTRLGVDRLVLHLVVVVLGQRSMIDNLNMALLVSARLSYN